jgi:hypothetical protein
VKARTILIQFVVCIDAISNLIRPETLAVRMTTDTAAVLGTLLGNNGLSLNYSLLCEIISAQTAPLLVILVSVVFS